LESRQRRKQLFENGMWDGLLKNMSKKDKEDLRRVVFFQGAFCFSGRPIPELDASQLPVTICDGSMSDGDVMKILEVFHYISPTEFQNDGLLPSKSKETDISCDLRCAGCTKAFTDLNALMQHWYVCQGETRKQ
jgi:hypothetical protein